MNWLNNARIISVFAVLLLHISSWFVSTAPVGSDDWWIGNICDSLSRWCVPVFVMISGALLLDPGKTSGLRVFYSRRMSRVVAPIIFWSIVYLAFTSMKDIARGDDINCMELFQMVLQGKPYYHLWYLYMILFIYLFSPFFKKITNASTDVELMFLVLSMFGVSMINAVVDSIRSPVDAKLFSNLFLDYIPYFFLGHLINRVEVKIRPLYLWLLFVILAATTAIGTYCLDVIRMQHVESYFYSNKSINVALMSLIVFLLFKTSTKPFISERMAKELSSIVLGVYLLHPLILEVLMYPMRNTQQPSAVTAIPALLMATFFLSALISMVMVKFPYLRRVI